MAIGFLFSLVGGKTVSGMEIYVMEVQEVEFFIEPDGKVTFEVRGVKGRRCLEITRDIEADLGGQILSRESTWEMNQAPAEEYTQDRLSQKE